MNRRNSGDKKRRDFFYPVVFILSLAFSLSSFPLFGQETERDPYEEQRKAMTVEIFREIPYSSELLKNAFLTVPRHLYVPKHYRTMAYTDNPIPLSGTSICPAPKILAQILSEANLTPSSKVLLSGTGTEYTMMILNQIVKELYVADSSFGGIIPGGVSVSRGESPESWAYTAPFDFIFIHKAVDEITPSVVAMLKPGGTLVAPVIDKYGIQTIVIIRKTENGLIFRSLGTSIFSGK